MRTTPDNGPHRLCRCDLCKRRRGCFVSRDPDITPPAGWCVVEKDDAPDFELDEVHLFDTDEDAAAWASNAARAAAEIDGVVHTAPLVDGAIPEGIWPGASVRLIVPILDALDRGLLEDEEIDDRGLLVL